MARTKATLKQNDFSRAAIRPEFLEADEDPIRQRSYRDGGNVRPTARKGLKRRPGLYREADLAGTALLGGTVSIKPVEGEEFVLVFVSGGVEIYDSTGALDASFSSLPWTAAPWVAPAGEQTFIGGDHDIYVLQFNGGSWSIGAMDFADLPSGALAQPYYKFADGSKITPSARTGSITVTASKAVFTADYVGLRIRYMDKEIEITAYTSATVVTGTVLEKLPPSFDITVNNAEGFEPGEVVEGADSGWNGYVTSVNTGTNVVKAVSLSGYEGPLTTEKLVGPNTKSGISAKSYAGPYASPYWTEPVISVVRGYARSGAIVNGRLILSDFESVPDLISASSTRALNDFGTGLDDDDAILRRVGDAGRRVRHVINAGDLVILTDNGAYYVNARDNTEITPATFAPTKFDSRSAGSARPVFVDNAVLYTNGQDVLVAVLSGNVYLNWTVIVASDGYDGMYGSVASFSVPGPDFSNEDRAVLMTMDDGTINAMYFNASFEDFGIFPWDFSAGTNVLRDEDECSALGAAAMGGTYWLTTERRMTAAGADNYFLERLSASTFLDFTTQVTGGDTVDLSDYAGAEITLTSGDYYLGTFASDTEAEAYVAAYPTAATIDVGLAWGPFVQPWPFEVIKSQRNGMLRARTIRVGVSVRDTTNFFVQRNSTKSVVSAYDFGDDLSAPPPRKTAVYRFPVFGNRDHPEIIIGQDTPGPFEIMAYIAEVQA